MSRIRRPYKVIFTYNVRIHWIITTGNLVYRTRSSVINNLNNSLRYTLVIDSLQKDRPTIHLVRLRLCVKYAFIPMPMRCPTYNIYEIRINHRNKCAQSFAPRQRERSLSMLLQCKMRCCARLHSRCRRRNGWWRGAHHYFHAFFTKQFLVRLYTLWVPKCVVVENCKQRIVGTFLVPENIV